MVSFFSSPHCLTLFFHKTEQSAMSLSVFLLWLVSIPLSINALPAPRGFLLDCGARKDTKVGSLNWITDEGFINTGNKTTLKTPNLVPILVTLRYFPDKTARKYCYEIPVIKGGKYMVRTTYYYGDFDGKNEPPVFDQIIEGTLWSTVNTTEDYANGLSSYYEIILGTKGKMLSICLARNKDTVSDPFISALEVEYLDNSMYNSTDFSKHTLIAVARHCFGHDGDLISFPEDPFNRYWQPFTDANPIVATKSNITSSNFWNQPPAKALQAAMTTSRGKTLSVQWPDVALPSGDYYISLYFQDNRSPSPYSWRVFNVSVNGKNFYTNLNVSASGVAVFGTWPLSGKTEITMVPAAGVPVGPVINAGEIFQIKPLGGRTLSRDWSAMNAIARSLNNPPLDWRGDPCMPRENSWTGVKCSESKYARISILNLTGMELSGELSPLVANLTALTDLWLGGNKLSGPIPDMNAMDALINLHLEENQFDGPIPPSLGQLQNLKELHLQNNNLKGPLPDSLKNRNGINIQVSPGNHLTGPA